MCPVAVIRSALAFARDLWLSIDYLSGFEHHKRDDFHSGTISHAGRFYGACHDPLANDCINETGVRPDLRSPTNLRVALKNFSGKQRDVRSELHVGVDGGRGRVPHRDPSSKPAVINTATKLPLGTSQLGPVVHARRFAGVFEHGGTGEVTTLVGNIDQIGEVYSFCEFCRPTMRSPAATNEIARLAAAELATEVKETTTCCYAIQDKVWLSGSDRERWEVYTVLADSESFGPAEETACCTSGATPVTVSLGTSAGCC